MKLEIAKLYLCRIDSTDSLDSTDSPMLPTNHFVIADFSFNQLFQHFLPLSRLDPEKSGLLSWMIQLVDRTKELFDDPHIFDKRLVMFALPPYSNSPLPSSCIDDICIIAELYLFLSAYSRILAST